MRIPAVPCCDICDTSDEEVVLPTYFEETLDNGLEAGLTYLLVIQSKTYLNFSFLSIQFALPSISLGEDPNNTYISKSLQKHIEQEAAR